MDKSRQLRTKRQNRETERRAALFCDVDWLNGRPSKARSRVVRLIELLKTADQLSRKLRAADASLSQRSSDGLESHKLLSTLDKVNKMFAPYRGARFLWVTDGYGLQEGFSCLSRKQLESEGAYYTETMLINYALGLLHSGSIQHLRTCRECKKWFYAMTDHQMRCSPKCRQRSFSRDPNFKERRRMYMREYRRKEWERDQRLRRISLRAK